MNIVELQPSPSAKQRIQDKIKNIKKRLQVIKSLEEQQQTFTMDLNESFGRSPKKSTFLQHANNRWKSYVI